MIWLPPKKEIFVSPGVRRKQGGFLLNPFRFGSSAPSYLDHFSATAYTGDGSYPRTITTGVDANDGLLWLKARSAANNNQLSWRNGSTRYNAATNTTTAPASVSNLTLGVSDFTLSSSTGVSANSSGVDYIAWSMQKRTGFLDVVRYTGNGTSSRAIAHAVGVTPSAVFIFAHVAAGRPFGHAGMHPTTPWSVGMNMINGAARGSVIDFGNTAPTSSSFYVGYSAGNGSNESGTVYTAFLFASDNSAIGRSFCFSYTGNGFATGPDVSCGWQPRYIMMKRATGVTTDWTILDTTRSPGFTGADLYLKCNATSGDTSNAMIELIPDGFRASGVVNNGLANSSGEIYVGIAIR